MTHASTSACAVLAAALLAGIVTPANASSGNRPKLMIQCLPAGSSSPAACATVPVGSTLLVSARSPRSSEPLTFYFNEISQYLRPKVISVDVPQQSRVADGSYAVTVPRQLCSGRSGRNQYEVRQVWRAMNLLEPIGVINVAC